MYEIAASTGAEVSRVAEAQAAEAQAKFMAIVDTAVKNAPAGTENAVALVKSAVAAANNAIETAQKAAKQAAEVAEANFKAMSTTAVRATKAQEGLSLDQQEQAPLNAERRRTLTRARSDPGFLKVVSSVPAIFEVPFGPVRAGPFCRAGELMRRGSDARAAAAQRVHVAAGLDRLRLRVVKSAPDTPASAGCSTRSASRSS